MSIDYFTNENIDISIIIPVYNAEKYLEKALNSILSQGSCNYEVIIVDDGSTDSSGAIMDSYCEKYEEFQGYHISNHGVSYARNFGLSKAKGEWIFFMDSDDELCGRMFSDLLSDKISDVDMIVFGAIFEYCYLNNSICRKAEATNLFNSDDYLCYFSNMTQETKDIFLNYLWTRLFRLKVIRNNNIKFDENLKLGEDFVFICNYLKYCKSVLVLSKEYYKYFLRGNESLVSRFDEKEYERRIIMRKTFRDLLCSFGIEAKNCKIFKNNEGMNCLSSIKKVLSPNCTLNSRKKKLQYVNSFMDDETIQYIIYYLNNNASVGNFVFKFIFRTKNKFLLLLCLQFQKMIQTLKCII